MGEPLRWVAIAAITAGLSLAATEPAAAARAVPGVVTQTAVAEHDFARMDRGGVQTLRFIIWRRYVETAPGQYDWSLVDPIVAGAANRGVTLLPFVYGSPDWVNPIEAHPPIDTAADRHGWRAFLAALVTRYGPGGEFWDGRDVIHPIRRWQIWNEPNFDFYWDPEPSPPDYARLISISADAIRAVDPGAKIMLAGVARVRLGMPWWQFLEQLYRAPGIKRDFDFVALHPYSPGVRVLNDYVELARAVMLRAGDSRTPLAITEIGWASAGQPEAPLVVGKRDQARLLARSFAFLAAPHPGWRISDVQWYSWRDTAAIEPFCSFCEHSGLFTASDRPKPAWRAFKRAVAQNPRAATLRG